MSRLSRRAALAILAVATVLAVGRLLVEAGPLADAGYLTAVIGASVLAALGVRSAPAGERTVPAIITVGLGAYAIGDVFWLANLWAGNEPDISLADPFYFASYLALATALAIITLVRHRGSRTIDVDAAIDAITVVVVSVIVFWSTAVRGIIDDSSLPVLHRTVFAIYPVADAIVLALALRVLVGRRTRDALGKSFVIGVGGWLFADLAYLTVPLEGRVLAVTDASWMLGAALMALATWRPQPSAPADQPQAETSTAGQLVRLAVALLPLLVLPILLVVSGARGREVEPVQALVAMLALVAVTTLRTARLLHSERQARAQLAEARDAALAASIAKSAFLATMSHEIRTPMNGVIGLNDLLLTTSLDARQRQYAEGVRGAGQALLDVINEILDFSKIESGHLELETVDFDVVALVEAVGQIVAEPARTKGLEVVAHCSPDLPTGLRGDPARLRQVLVNLAGNAVKFTPTGQVVVRARLEPSPAEEVSVRFEVVDTGIGIAEEGRQRLFEPFSQADSSTTRMYGGTGLGLAISQQLVEAMGGRLEVSSTPGRGSTFSFVVPLAPALDPSVGSPAPVTHLAGLRALLVDGDSPHRGALREQLEHWGTTVDVADSPRAGLERILAEQAAGRPYELALVDLDLPGADQVATRVSTEPGLIGTGLVLMSAGHEDTTRGVSGAVTLTRPLQFSRLPQTLAQVLAERATPTPARTPVGVATPATRGRVLVVEDGEVNQLVAVGVLTHLGYVVEVAEDGYEAVAAVQRTNFDAILMDVQMPGMDGYEATAEIRRLESGGRRTPIVAMTAGAVDGERERCLGAGMDDYLTKPFQRATVAAILETWVQPGTPSSVSTSASRPGASVATSPRTLSS